MYAFMLLLGAVSTAAGLALVASGVAHDGAAAITPGIVAALGGLVLIGLGLVVRELQRIERALTARPMPRAARPSEAGAAAERAGAPRIPFPPKPKPEAHPQAAPLAASNAPTPTEEPALETLREKFPTLVRLDNAPVVEETDVSLSPGTPARAEEVVSEVEARAAVGRVNGAPARLAPRPDVQARPSGAPQRLKGAMFDAFWPKGQRPRRNAQAAAVQVVAPTAVEPPQPSQAQAAPAAAQPAAEPRVVAGAPEAAAVPISVLKSGVVEGMAYTLYSDGSIEAQLPQGTLRFGSITELRNHIENG